MSNYKALVDYYKACETERNQAKAKYEKECKAVLKQLDASLWVWFGCGSHTLLEVDGGPDPSGLYRGEATLKFGAHSVRAAFVLPVSKQGVVLRLDGIDYPIATDAYSEALYRAFFDAFARLIATRLAYSPPTDGPAATPAPSAVPAER